MCKKKIYLCVYSDNVEIRNVTIKNINNDGNDGSELCGKYHDSQDGGIEGGLDEAGYSGKTARGICITNSTLTMSNIELNNINSARGDSIGIDIILDSRVIVNRAHISQLNAGYDLTERDIRKLIRKPYPNLVPYVCAIANQTAKYVEFHDIIIDFNTIVGQESCYD